MSPVSLSLTVLFRFRLLLSSFINGRIISRVVHESTFSFQIGIENLFETSTCKTDNSSLNLFTSHRYICRTLCIFPQRGFYISSRLFLDYLIFLFAARS